MAKLNEAFHQVCQKENAVRCVILKSGVIGVFSAGADLKVMYLDVNLNFKMNPYLQERIGMSPKGVLQYLMSLQRLISTIEHLRIPVIAAVDGPALGGGLELLLGCDIRVAGPRAVFGLPEVRLGVIPGAGGTVRLANDIGGTRARDMILSGRRIDGDTAERWGLVSHSVQDAGTMALSLAMDIVKGAPLALHMAKVSLTAARMLPHQDALRAETLCYSTLLNTQDRREGLEAWSQRRLPNFVGN